MGAIYRMFKNSISNVVNKQQGEEIQLHKLLELQAAFIKFCVHTFPDRIEYVDEILQISVVLCGKVRPEEYTEEVLDSIVQILSHPLETMSIVVLNLAEYPKLMSYLPFLKRKKVALKIVQAVINTKTYLITLPIISKLISFISPLIEEQQDSVATSSSEVETELALVSRLLGLIESHNPLVTLQLLGLMEAKIVKLPPEYRKLLVPAYVTAVCRAMRRIVQVRQLLAEEDAEEKIKEGFNRVSSATYLSEKEREEFSFKIDTFDFDFGAYFLKIRDLVEDLSIDFPKVSIRLNLQLALLISEVDETKEHEEFQTDLCSETLELFQDEVTDPKEKVASADAGVLPRVHHRHILPHKEPFRREQRLSDAQHDVLRFESAAEERQSADAAEVQQSLLQPAPEERRARQRDLEESAEVREERDEARRGERVGVREHPGQDHLPAGARPALGSRW